MKARIKGTNDLFQEVTGIEIDYAIYDPEVIEFENDFIPNNTTIKDEHWQDVRERAAIAALSGLCANPKLVDAGTFETSYDIGVWKAMELADELIKKLKRK